MKQGRQEKILDLVQNGIVENQDQLLLKLREAGYEVTQATVSRDIRDLKLIKVSCGLGVYKYIISSQSAFKSSVKFHNIMKDTVISAECAGNLVVVKTHSGMAQASGAAIDAMSWSDIVGSVAGDDTLLLVFRTPDVARTFALEFQDTYLN